MSNKENDQEFPRGMDPQTRGFLRALRAGDGPPLHEFSIAQARSLMRDMQTADVSGYPVEVQEINLQSYSLQIVRPRNMTEPLPAVMFFHGGGWALGEMKTHARLVREIVVGVNAAVVFVSYTRAPEARYPRQLNSATQATQYVHEHAATSTSTHCGWPSRATVPAGTLRRRSLFWRRSAAHQPFACKCCSARCWIATSIRHPIRPSERASILTARQCSGFGITTLPMPPRAWSHWPAVANRKRRVISLGARAYCYQRIRRATG